MTSPYDVLARITNARRVQQPTGERCEMCSEAIADQHQHVVNVAGRQLMCVCRGCYLLFTDGHAQLRYRAVPDRYLSFPDFALDRRAWELLQIPVGLAFFFRNSALDRTVDEPADRRAFQPQIRRKFSHRRFAVTQYPQYPQLSQRQIVLRSNAVQHRDHSERHLHEIVPEVIGRLHGVNLTLK